MLTAGVVGLIVTSQVPWHAWDTEPTITSVGVDCIAPNLQSGGMAKNHAVVNYISMGQWHTSLNINAPISRNTEKIDAPRRSA